VAQGFFIANFPRRPKILGGFLKKARKRSQQTDPQEQIAVDD
jgi:hypothetical protein